MAGITQTAVWRKQNHLNEHPTVDTVVIHAEDKIYERNIYELVICHVNSFHGKGFMPSVRFEDSLCYNGEVILGTDQAAYDQAKMTGEQRLEKFIKDIAIEMAKYKE